MSRQVGNRAPRFAFIGWNPFQIRHSSHVARLLPNSVFLVEARKKHPFAFEPEQLDGSLVPSMIWKRGQLSELDGVFDVIVCQTVFPQIERCRQSKIAMLQYGLAKEAHNYGTWRSLADLNLSYGSYSSRHLEHYGPVATVGNPAYDRWHAPDYHKRIKARWSQKLDASRKTILYVPTWGDLSTANLFIDDVVKLAEEHNVILKMHHNTALLERGRARKLRRGELHVLGENDDLLDALVVADVVLSDYSGAIFDAVYCGRPVLLLQTDSEERFGAKLDRWSLEHAERDRLGTVVPTPSRLAAALDSALSRPALPPQDLVDDLFVPGPGAAERAADELLKLAHDEHPELSQVQRYVRETFRETRLPASRRTKAGLPSENRL